MINIYNQTKQDLIDIKKILLNLFKTNEVSESFSIIFVSPKEIKRLNKTYRNKNKVTDVLSFISEEKDYQGDIFICLKQALKQAKRYHHSEIREIAFLATHGYLHLLGFDHQNEAAEKQMFLKQETMLEKANIERTSL